MRVGGRQRERALATLVGERKLTGDVDRAFPLAAAAYHDAQERHTRGTVVLMLDD